MMLLNKQDFKEIEGVVLTAVQRVSQRYVDNLTNNLAELRQLVREHPWDALGASFSLGFALGLPKYRKSLALAVWGFLNTSSAIESNKGAQNEESIQRP